MAVEIPDAIVHSRFLKNGLTKYEHDEIISAIQDFEKCEQEYNALAEQAFDLIGEFDKIGMIVYASEPIQALYSLMHSGLIPSIQIGDSKEHWPVKTWQKEISKYRSLNKKSIRQ